MIDILEKYLPSHAVKPCFELIRVTETNLRVVNSRRSKHGDFRIMPDGKPRITVNASSNKYRFLITLIHEIAHLVAYKKHGLRIKPHGVEWKDTFRELIQPFLSVKIFPKEILLLVCNHFKNPKASSDSDIGLSLGLKCYDKPNNKTLLKEVAIGGVFRLYDGRVFVKGKKRVSRYVCRELRGGKVYIFNPIAEVEKADIKV